MAKTYSDSLLVEQQFRTIRTVHWYAAQLSVAEKRLAQATANTLGKRPKELLDERVILEAKRLLVHTRATSKEVGFVLGFAESTNFIISLTNPHVKFYPAYCSFPVRRPTGTSCCAAS